MVDLERWLKRYSDVFLAGLVVGIIGMMIVPLPTLVLDLLLALNISLAVTLLMVSLYIPSALKIASFPSILLITTLFRLALNVSSTRLILLNADAGEVIAAFGEFVVQGNFVVGAVIFLILTLIQFLVIAKGSERVSEVAARFTLDAMPGKQMSIDADLRAGAFDLDEARRRRSLVQRESQLYGAMDGAMKFVKGDAIAGIIMTAINIVAGMIIGVMQLDMSAGDAAQVYTLLTIGDGLVSQIPALLIATTAGIIVTRVASEDEGSHLGGDIFSQLLDQPKALAIAAALLLGLALIPGLPVVPFLALGLGAGTIAYALQRARAGSGGLSEQEARDVESIEAQASQGARQARAMVPAVAPLTVELGAALTSAMGEERERWLQEMIPAMREGVFFETGVKVPGVRVRSSGGSGNELRVLLDEVPVARTSMPLEDVMVGDDPEGVAVFGVEAREAVHPVTGQPACWVPAAERTRLEEAGYQVWDLADYVLLKMTAEIKEHAHRFVTLQSVRGMLDQLEGPYPALVAEVVPRQLGLQELTEILKRLAEEGISLRNLPTILEVLADRARAEKNPVKLTEDVRTGLSPYITHKYSGGEGSVLVYVVDREIEEIIHSAIRIGERGSFLTLAPEEIQEIQAAVRARVKGEVAGARAPILLTDQRVRRYIKRLVSMEIPNAVVLAYQELDPALTIQPLGRIEISRY
ncbi:EscV/YscV/HrcV family type III secretion system export apparatus protein [Lujinxingia litoralis]|uniref:EscV/YscV/HrcV family type III secretion system export apparatus protein n=2 Tax=Lujinxingia litoralis TaxID=2211119 RepID=A0A328CAB8_9DELT|nr:EscV/YscV/HrcV family type III secretion system export apparatus protein [Lujinxingia litoralis]